MTDQSCPSVPGWSFDNSYARLPELFFRKQNPTPARRPAPVVFNHQLAAQLGLDLKAADPLSVAAVFAGNQVPPGSEPLAQAYAGHQFGNFTMLGDGRAILLGEHLTPDGLRLDIHLKGAGQTPYSRRGDGRAALGPMLREYLISEAMVALGIPTTRSLAVVTTGEAVYREAALPGAVLTRVAASHLRVGTFEYAAAYQNGEGLTALVNYTLARHYPELLDEEHPVQALLSAVIDRQADLITHWMRVGFVHGVMNTDNMTISGETIDYGPCAFMDAYDPATVFSSIDRHGRYAFGRQAVIAQWNLARFAESLLPLLHPRQDEAIAIAEQAINGFKDRFDQRWLQMMGRKLGLFDVRAGDEQLVRDLLGWMQTTGADYTNTFRSLSPLGLLSEEQAADPVLEEWHQTWQPRLQQQGQDVQAALALMNSQNPAYIPRNHLVEQALAAAHEGDLGAFGALLGVLEAPYEQRSGLEAYAAPPPPSDEPYQTFCGT